MAKALSQLLASDEFIHGIELVTSRGILQNEGSQTLRFAHELMDYHLLDFISITDNPGGSPMMAPETLGLSLLKEGHNVNIHITCKDRNRNALEMRAWQFASDGFNNILALTGDYPTGGYRGIASPVFDIDSVSLISMLSDMNNGLNVELRGGKTKHLSQTKFLISAAVSPFKMAEAEYLTQYFKMEKKVRAGANFFILQLGYDTRKWAELLQHVNRLGITTPLLANVYVLSKTVAKMFNRNAIPGAHVPDNLLEVVEKEVSSSDKGHEFFMDFAAKQYAVAKHLGFKGVYLGGVKSVDEVRIIKEKAAVYEKEDYRSLFKEMLYPLKKEFYLYEQNEETLLPKQVFDKHYLRSISGGRRFVKRLFSTSPLYHISRFVHLLLFNNHSPLYAFMRLLYRFVDGKFIDRFSHSVEKVLKSILYDCRDCGDCSLPETAYLCPVSKCSKNQRNGPCGGSYNGRCELDDKECIWSVAYKRLKAYGEERVILSTDIVFTNAKLLETSGWKNFYLKRDHARNNENNPY